MSESRTNAWGWIGLILVVGLIGAGFLYQREGGRLFPVRVVSDAGTSDPIAKQSVNGSRERPFNHPDPNGGNASRSWTTDTQSNPPPPSANGTRSNDAKAIRPNRSAPGTVNVQLKFATDWESYERNNGRLDADGPWVYVDGQLHRFADGQWMRIEGEPHQFADGRWGYINGYHVRLDASGKGGTTFQKTDGPELPQGQIWMRASTTLYLAPRNYLIEGVVEGYELSGRFPNRDAFVLKTESRRIEVESGKTVKFAAEFPAHFIVSKPKPYLAVDEFTHVVGLELDSVRTKFGAWLQDYTDRADRQVSLFDDDLIVSALRHADKRFGRESRQKGIAMVYLPEKPCGGPRELTAIQVRLIVDWLNRKYWGDWPDADSLRLAASSAPNREANVRQINLLDDIIKRQREKIDQLGALTRKLDQATTP
jgi:hypothetical protein